MGTENTPRLPTVRQTPSGSFRIIWFPVTEEFRLRLLEFPLSARSSEVIFSIPYSYRPSTHAGSLHLFRNGYCLLPSFYVYLRVL